MAAGENVEIMKIEVVRRVAVSSIARLDVGRVVGSGRRATKCPPKAAGEKQKK
jgi:hypothetical protein